MAVLKFYGGKPVQWSDQDVYINGVPTKTAIKGIKFGITVDDQYIYAGGNDPLEIQSGNREPHFTLTLLAGAVWAMHDAAIAGGGQDLTDLRFDQGIKFTQQGVIGMRLISLIGCKVNSFEEGMMQGDKEMPVTLTGKFLRMEINQL